MLPRTHKQGFTLIEMIVSLAIFSFVITIAVGALLMLMSANKQLQGEQSVMTNLSFALDSMAREIRTGTFYYCESKSNYSGTDNIFNSINNLDDDRLLKDLSTNPTTYYYKDCPNGNSSSNQLQGLAFIEGGNSITKNNQRILYFFDKTAGKVYRRVGGGAAESIVSSGITIKNFEFFVTGSKKVSICGPDPSAACIATVGDQPAVTIFIEASESADPTAKSYYVQTTVTERTLDI
jgi:prepilin-type N-terminal cleavage/methylation domain-containing protein